MRDISVIIRISTNASDQEMDHLLSGIAQDSIREALGLGHDSDGHQMQERITEIKWVERGALRSHAVVGGEAN